MILSFLFISSMYIDSSIDVCVYAAYMCIHFNLSEQTRFPAKSTSTEKRMVITFRDEE